MRYSLDWLREWIDLPQSQRDLEDALTFGGLEIEEVVAAGPDLSGFVVGHVTECARHPEADRLSLCRVDVGEGEAVPIVCGAPNVAAGQKVAVARPGTLLPDGTKIKKSKIRGETSLGMICSESELGLGSGHAGILELDTDAAPGTSLSLVVSAGDVVLDVEVTPNRGDWASMLGLAREVRAHFGGEVRMPPLDVDEAGPDISESVASIRIDAPDLCHRYVARVVRGVDPARPSPEWLVRKLEAAGMRSLGVLVDITNLVMLEFGQPLHAFDLATLRGPEIRVRRAGEGEKLVTLDGQVRALAPDDLVIADAERAIAVAGVMGGAETEVRSGTRDILIESANFDPVSVRRTAKRLGLRSEASYRFERRVDRDGVARAADRTARLMVELAGGACARGSIDVRGDAPSAVETVELDPGHPNRLLGLDLSPEEVTSLLARVDIEATPGPGGALACRIPSYRNDISIAQDLVEEVARVYGYNRLPSTLPMAPVGKVTRPAELVLADRARDALVAAGFTELMTFPGTWAADLDALRVPADSELRRAVTVLNPFVEREAELCTTLLPSLLHTASRNLAHQVSDLRIFELAPVFHARTGGELPREPLHVAILIARAEARSLWSRGEAAPLFFELRGIVERLARELGLDLELRADGDVPHLVPGASAAVLVQGVGLGAMGELHPDVARAFGIEIEAAVVELDLCAVAVPERRARAVSPVSRHPAARRDVAALFARDARAGEICDAIAKTAGDLLVGVEVFDRFSGQGIPEDKVSLAFRMTFQHPDRNLRDKEITKATDRVRKMLEKRFGGELR